MISFVGDGNFNVVDCVADGGVGIGVVDGIGTMKRFGDGVPSVLVWSAFSTTLINDSRAFFTNSGWSCLKLSMFLFLDLILGNLFLEVTITFFF